MFDYFRIDSNWPGLAEVRQQILSGTTLTSSRKAEMIETAMLNEIVKSFSGYDAEKRFLQYIEMHEFEALLFSDANILAEKTGIDVSQLLQEMRREGAIRIVGSRRGKRARWGIV